MNRVATDGRLDADEINHPMDQAIQAEDNEHDDPSLSRKKRRGRSRPLQTQRQRPEGEEPEPEELNQPNEAENEDQPMDDEREISNCDHQVETAEPAPNRRENLVLPDFDSLRRAKYQMSNADWARAKDQFAILCTSTVDSEDYEHAYRTVRECSCYLAVAGNQNEFDQMVEAWRTPHPRPKSPTHGADDVVIPPNHGNQTACLRPPAAHAVPGGEHTETKRSSTPKDHPRPTANVGSPKEKAKLHQAEQFHFPLQQQGQDHPVTPAQGLQLGDPEVVDWASRINQQASHSAIALVKLGQLFADAKDRLGHGRWEGMFNSGQVRFSLRWAQKLMQVARNTALSKATNSSFLPPSPDALSALARLEPTILDAGIEGGKIRPDMTIAEAKRFVLDESPQKSGVADRNLFDYEKVLESLCKRVEKGISVVPEDKVQQLVGDLVKRIRSYDKSARLLAA